MQMRAVLQLQSSVTEFMSHANVQQMVQNDKNSQKLLKLMNAILVVPAARLFQMQVAEAKWSGQA